MSDKLIKIEKALNEIRPFLQSDGGNIELVSLEKNIVKVRLLGNLRMALLMMVGKAVGK